MYDKISAVAVLIAAYIIAVSAACSFPPNHPNVSLHGVNESATETVYDSIYVYTDPFHTCSGRVTDMSVCYGVSLAGLTQISVGIINEKNTIIHVHNIYGSLDSFENQVVVCHELDQFFARCCLHETLTPSEQFTVETNYHFGVWGSESLFIDRTLTASGYYTSSPVEVGRNLSSDRSDSTETTVQILYFYFNIIPGNCTTASPPHTVNNGGLHTIPQASASATEFTESQVMGANSVTHDHHLSLTSTVQYIWTTEIHSVANTNPIYHPSTTSYPSGTFTTTDSTAHSYSSTDRAMGAIPSSVLPPHTETVTGTSTPTSLIGAVCSIAVVVLLITVFITIGILVKLRANAKQKRIKATYLLQSDMKTERPTQIVPKPITTNRNSSYASFSQSGTADETVLYSYVPQDSDQHHSWKAATHIPINSNEAYATKQQQSSPTSNTAPEESDYIVNSLVYERVDREFKTDGTCSDGDTVVNLLTYEMVERDTQQPKQDVVDFEILTTNEAYVCSNEMVERDTQHLKEDVMDLEILTTNEAYVSSNDVVERDTQHSNQDVVDFEILTTNEAYVSSNEMVERDTQHSKEDVMDIEILTNNEAYVSSNDVMERDTQHLKQDVVDFEILNEAYVCSNHTPIPNTLNEATAQSSHDNTA